MLAMSSSSVAADSWCCIKADELLNSNMTSNWTVANKDPNTTHLNLDHTTLKIINTCCTTTSMSVRIFCLAFVNSLSLHDVNVEAGGVNTASLLMKLQEEEVCLV